MSNAERRARFRELHAADGLFVMPNPWDIGSARLLASLGFKPLATTSAGLAWSLGKDDQTVSREELVGHVEALAAATPLPLNVDSERCYPDQPGGVAETVAMLAAAGAPGFRSRTMTRRPGASTSSASPPSESRPPLRPHIACPTRWF
jgi:2-methylisocitrate lyase-like PEP mutase family enzyme